MGDRSSRPRHVPRKTDQALALRVTELRRQRQTGAHIALETGVSPATVSRILKRVGPSKSMREVESETLKWVDWYNNRRLLGPIVYVPPAEAEETFYANLNSLDMVA